MSIARSALGNSGEFAVRVSRPKPGRIKMHGPLKAGGCRGLDDVNFYSPVLDGRYFAGICIGQCTCLTGYNSFWMMQFMIPARDQALPAPKFDIMTINQVPSLLIGCIVVIAD